MLGPCGLQTISILTTQMHPKPVITVHCHIELDLQKGYCIINSWWYRGELGSLNFTGFGTSEVFCILMLRNNISESRPDNKECIYSTEVTLDIITESMVMNLSKLRKTVEDRGAWCAAVHRVAKSPTQFSDWTTTTTLKNARAWCTGKTQRNRVEREVGGGMGMGNTCNSMAYSCQCMTKTTSIL